MAIDERETYEAIEACFAEWRRRGVRMRELQVTSREAASEVNALEQALLSHATTLATLVRRHKVPLGSLVKRLLSYRITWRFGSPWRLFANWSVPAIERMPKTLARAADFLADAGQVLVDQWVKQIEEHGAALDRGEYPELDDADPAELFTFGGWEPAAPDPKTGEEQVILPLSKQVRIAVRVLRCAAGRCRRWGGGAQPTSAVKQFSGAASVGCRDWRRPPRMTW